MAAAVCVFGVGGATALPLRLALDGLGQPVFIGYLMAAAVCVFGVGGATALPLRLALDGAGLFS